jgi:hypothetical protein
MSTKQQTNNQLSVDIAVISEKIVNIERMLTNIQKRLDEDYATKEWCESKFGEPTRQFKAIISLVVSAVTVAVIGLVIKK